MRRWRGKYRPAQNTLGAFKKLHDSSTAVLSVHEDCGAGAKKEDLLKAAETARSLGFEPKLFYISLMALGKKSKQIE